MGITKATATRRILSYLYLNKKYCSCESNQLPSSCFIANSGGVTSSLTLVLCAGAPENIRSSTANVWQLQLSL